MNFFEAHLVDIILAVIILVSFGLGAKRGLWKSLSKLVAIVLAILGSSFLGGKLYSVIYEWFGPKTIEKLITKIETGTSIDKLKELPIVGEALQSGVHNAVETAVTDLVGKFLQGAAFIVLFIILWAVFNVVLNIVNSGIEALPIIHGVNNLGGAVIGAAYGLFWCYVFVFVCDKFNWFYESVHSSVIAQKLIEANLIDKALALFIK